VAEFAPGIDLGRAFYQEVVAPRLAGRRHSAARLGAGSDVLGFRPAICRQIGRVFEAVTPIIVPNEPA
jgi:hypothetical protein